LFLTNRETAQCIAVKTDGATFVQAAGTQIIVHASLDDAEKQLTLAPMYLFATLRPAGGQFQRTTDIVVICRGRGAFVKAHDDIRTQRLLYLYGQFRGQSVVGTVQ